MLLLQIKIPGVGIWGDVSSQPPISTGGHTYTAVDAPSPASEHRDTCVKANTSQHNTSQHQPTQYQPTQHQPTTPACWLSCHSQGPEPHALLSSYDEHMSCAHYHWVLVSNLQLHSSIIFHKSLNFSRAVSSPVSVQWFRPDSLEVDGGKGRPRLAPTSMLESVSKRLRHLARPMVKNPEVRDFPGGTVVGSPPANAGDTGSIPGLGGSHMPWSNWARVPQLLSLRSRAYEPQLPSSHATTPEAHAPRARAPQQEKPPQWEAHALQWRAAPAHHN